MTKTTEAIEQFFKDRLAGGAPTFTGTDLAAAVAAKVAVTPKTAIQAMRRLRSMGRVKYVTLGRKFSKYEAQA